MSFATRVACATSLLIVATCVAQSAMLVHRDLEQVGRFLAAQGRTLSETLARDAELAIMSRDRTGLQDLVRQLLNRVDVVYCRILDEQGQPLVEGGRVPATPPAVSDESREPIPIDGLWELQAAVRMLDTRPQREEIQLFDGDAAPSGVEPRGQRIGTVAIGMSLEPLRELRRQTFVAATLLTGLVTVIAIALAVVTARAVTRPLQVLASAADDLASGNMAVRVPTFTQDEIGAVALSFNAMADSLARGRATLEAYNHSLEEKVTARTQHLEALNRRLEEASRLKSEFLATVSHELRTPLNVILGYLEMLADGASGPLTASQREMLDAIARYSKLQLGLITNVLDFSRLSSGRISFHVERFALGSLLEEIRVLAGSRLRAGVALTVDAAPNLPELETDRVKLQEIVRNLVDNAVKFTEQGAVAVTARSESHGRTVVIEVNDTGRGIAADQLTSIFEPFRQVGDQHFRHSTGVGLGLSIVKQLVEALGGTVSVVSIVAAGSRFRVEVPCVLAASPAVVAQAS
ncbi:MAG: ATP-binding protein [Candidatus Binatia bacterium]